MHTIILAVFLLLPNASFTLASESKQNDVKREIVERALLAMLNSANKLSSFSFHGELECEYSPEFVNHLKGMQLPPNRTVKQDISVSAVEGVLKVSVDEVPSEGREPESFSYYLNEKALIFEQRGNGSHAMILPRSSSPLNQHIYDFPGVMPEAAFLSPSVKEFGLPLLTPQQLKSSPAWAQCQKNLQVSQGENGEVGFSISSPDGRWDVELKSINGGAMLPVRLQFLDARNNLIREIEILSYSYFDEIGLTASAVKLKTFASVGPNKSLIPVATWTTRFKEMNFNAIVDEENVAFNPSSVDRIWDEATKVEITVPR